MNTTKQKERKCKMEDLHEIVDMFPLSEDYIVKHARILLDLIPEKIHTITHELIREHCMENKPIQHILKQSWFDWHRTDQYGMYPLHNICKFGIKKTIQWVIHSFHDLDWNMYNWDEHTCLFMVMTNIKLSGHDRIAIMKQMIHLGANPDQPMYMKNPYTLFDVFIHSKVVRPKLWIEYFNILYPTHYPYTDKLHIFLKTKLSPDIYEKIKSIMDNRP